MAHFRRVQKAVSRELKLERNNRNSLIADMMVNKFVRLIDDTNFESGMCSNGGRYGFWTDFTYEDDGTWVKKFGTTADFNYCDVRGEFQQRCSDCSQYDWDEGCQAPKETITTGALIEFLLYEFNRNNEKIYLQFHK